MNPEEKFLTIGKVARATGMGAETIRFYEREGLIPKPPRRPSGYREYPPNTMDRIHFITRAKELGFTLREIKEFLSLRVDAHKTCADVRKKAQVKIEEVKKRIHELSSIQNAIKILIKQCTGKGPTSECPILENLQTRRRS